MKKGLKRGAAVLLVLLQVFGLCGCSALDTMREAQAVYEENGDIVRSGVTYRLLPECDDLSPSYEYTDDNLTYVTEPDVPVLLSGIFCLDELAKSKDGNFLISMYENRVYCRLELYDSVCQRIYEGFTVETLRYSYFTWDDNDDGSEYYVLTQEQMAAVYQLMDTVEPMSMGNGWYLNGEYWISLEECSQDLLFCRMELEIVITGEEYTLLRNGNNETLAYTVPEEYKPVFQQIVSAYVAAEDSMPIW